MEPETKVDAKELQRWRLILGKLADEPLKNMACRGGFCGEGDPLISGDFVEMDEAMEAVYPSEEENELTRDEWEAEKSVGPHGSVKGRTFPKVAKWLDQIRTFFPSDVVVLLQIDHELDPPIRYVAALVRRAAPTPGAAELLDFLAGDEARAIFERHGFLALPPAR